MGNIHIRASDIRARRPIGKIGDRAYSSILDVIGTLINADPQAKQVDTVTVDTATNAATYTVTIDGVAVTFTADASATKPEVSAGLLLAIQADGVTSGAVVVTDDAVDTLTLTARWPGVAFTVAVGALLSTASVTASAAADVIPFGRGIIRTGLGSADSNLSGDGAYASNSSLCALPKEASLAKRVSTLTVTYAAAEEYTVSITCDEVAYHIGPVLADTDDDTTAAAINTAINAMMPANTVIGTVATDTVTLTAECEGKHFEVSLGLKTGTTARLVLADTTNTLITDINKVFAGGAMYAYDEEASASGTGEYPANAGVKAMSGGAMIVSNSQNPGHNDRVYLETTAGSDVGKFYNAGTATRILLTSARWDRPGPVSGDSLAVIRF